MAATTWTRLTTQRVTKQHLIDLLCEEHGYYRSALLGLSLDVLGILLDDATGLGVDSLPRGSVLRGYETAQ